VCFLLFLVGFEQSMLTMKEKGRGWPLLGFSTGSSAAAEFDNLRRKNGRLPNLAAYIIGNLSIKIQIVNVICFARLCIVFRTARYSAT
jgi:hypothetical protein